MSETEKPNPDRSQSSLIGQKLSRFLIRKEIGRGGMGNVYLADDLRLRRRVALKVLPAETQKDAEYISRLRREAEAASSLNHPNIITIYDVGCSKGIPFIASEYIEGETLGQRLKRGSLDLAEALEIALQIASALDIAHEAKIIHRDIKPQNIMLRSCDNGVKVVDWGLARSYEIESYLVDLEEKTKKQFPKEDELGTLEYLSPERIQLKPADSRSDIWNLGVVLYEMLTGTNPFLRTTVGETIAAIQRDEIPPLKEDSPEALVHILRRALQKEPNRRYQTIKDLILDLDEFKRDLEIAEEVERSLPPPFRTRRSNERSGFYDYRILISILCVLIVIVGFISSTRSFSNQASASHLVIARPDAVETIAVMPFVNATGDTKNDIYWDGIAYFLNDNLSLLQPTLTVKARSSVSRFKNVAIDPEKLGRELDVQALLIGRVERNDEIFVLSVELINTKGIHLRAKQYPFVTLDFASLQKEITLDVSRWLRPNLSSSDAQRITKNYNTSTAALEFYIQGRSFWKKRTKPDLEEAERLFNLAVKQDPEFALAYVGLADTYALKEEYSGLPSVPTLQKAREYVQKALDRDDTLAEAHITLAYILTKSWKWAEAEEQFVRGLNLNPGYSTGYHWYCLHLRNVGDLEKAQKQIQMGYQTDPISSIIQANLVINYLIQGKDDDARTLGEKLVDVYKESWAGYSWLGMSQLKKPELRSKAIENLKYAVERSAGSHTLLANLGYGYAISGKPNEANEVIDKLKKLYRASPKAATGQDIAKVYAGLGNKAKVFEWLEKDYAVKSGDLPNIVWHPAFESLQKDNDFRDLVLRMGLQPGS